MWGTLNHAGFSAGPFSSLVTVNWNSIRVDIWIGDAADGATVQTALACREFSPVANNDLRICT